MTTVEDLVPFLAGALVLAGVAVVASRRRELVVRWCLWAVAVPAVAAAFWVGEPAVASVVAVVGVAAALEYGTLVRLRPTDRVVLAVGVVAVVLAGWLVPDEVLRVGGLAAVALAMVPVLSGDADDGLRRLGLGALGLLWLGVLAGAAPLGVTALVLFVAVSLADVVAYFAGPRLGGPRLSSLSPAKRWSGAVAGAAAGVAVLLLVDAATWPLVAAVALGAPVGDLVESMVKRGVRTKDSAGWLAGQGGLLDRIDSLLGALAVLLLLG